MVLKKVPIQGRVTPSDLKSQRYAELEAAYMQQLRILRSLLRTARSKHFRSRGHKV